METMTKEQEQEIGQPKEKMVLLYEDANTVRNYKKMASRNCKDLTNLLVALNKLNLEIQFSIEDLFNFILNDRTYLDRTIRSRMVKEEDLKTSSGLRKNRSSVEAEIEIPNLDEVLVLAGGLKEQLSAQRYDGVLKAEMFIISGNEVVLDVKDFELLLDKSRILLPESDFALLDQAIENMNQLLAKYGGKPNRGEIQKSMILFDSKNTGCEVNHKFFKNI